MRELSHNAPFEPIENEVAERTDQGNSLETARQQVAELYGFLTWRQLEVHLQIGIEPRDDFLHLACLSYVWWDRTARWELAREMLAQDPALENSSIYAACVTGNAELVERFLDDDPSLLDHRGGYYDWEPLLYACYSRLNLPDRSTTDVVRLLLERGANPRAYYRWGGIYHFSALTGIIGEGEQGPINQPEHPEWESLARRLLAAGADCNDSQALYNRMFEPDNRVLTLLLEHGLNKDHVCNWFATDADGELVPNPEKTLDYQLQWAVKNNMLDRVDILLEHGADPNQVLRNDGSLTKIAATHGFNEDASQLEAHGAEPYEMSEVEQFLNHCLSANQAAAHAMLVKTPTLVAQANRHDAQAMNHVADNGASNAVELMLDLGFDVQGASGESPLHHAAHNGHLDTVKTLLKHGASLDQRDSTYLSTPLGWAQAGNKFEVIDYLQGLNIGLFDMIAVEDAERVRAAVRSDPESLNKPMRDLVEDTLRDHPSAWQTPLAYAAIRRMSKIVETLLELGAQKDVKNYEGTSLPDLCDEEIKKLLV